MRKWDVSALRKLTGITVTNAKLFEEAFTHRSYLNEAPKGAHADNQRLEFLGDAVLGFVVADHLFRLYPNATEGNLTEMRANLVCEASLANISKKLQLGELIILSRSEQLTGGRTRASLLADLFESFLGALYLDSGIEEVRDFLNVHFFPVVLSEQWPVVFNYKSTLQEYVQHKALGQLRYEIVDSRGPSHNMEFESHAFIDTQLIGRGRGRSKREAEQAAACNALQLLNVELKK
jgi:ribonuclease-3